VVALLGVVILAALALVAGGAWSYWRVSEALRDTRQQLAEAEGQRDQAASNLDRARRYQHAAHLNLAQQALDGGDVPRAQRLLEALRPRTGEEDLRGFDWFHLRSRLHPAEARRPDRLMGHEGRVRCLAFSPDYRILATGGQDQSVRIWNVTTGEQMQVLRGHTQEVIALAFRPDGRELLSTSGDLQGPGNRRPGEIKIWEVRSGGLQTTLRRHNGFVRATALSPDGRLLVTAGSSDGKVQVLEVLGLRERGSLRPTPAPTAPEPSSDPQVQAQRQQEMMAAMTLGPVLCLAFSPDGTLLASGSWNQTVRLWDAQTLEQVALFHTPAGVEDVAFAPDARTLAAVQRGGVLLWDLSTRKPRARLDVRDNWAQALAFAPDGRTLATGARNGSVQLWDPVSGLERLTLQGHAAAVHSVAFSRDGMVLATGDESGLVRLWHAPVAREGGP
jgi:WD40 repeat protein